MHEQHAVVDGLHLGSISAPSRGQVVFLSIDLGLSVVFNMLSAPPSTDGRDAGDEPVYHLRDLAETSLACSRCS